MNKIRLTQNALKIRDAFRDISFPETLKECFIGTSSFRGVDTPNLIRAISRTADKIRRQKEHLKNDVTDIIKDYDEDFKILKSVLKWDINYLLHNCSVWAVTSNDIGDYVPVKNLFINGKEETIRIAENEDERRRLGYYDLSTGCIVIFIDRIISNYQDDNPELELQKILLHEFIHAILDIAPCKIVLSECGFPILERLQNVHYDYKKEETYDNVLVLETYKEYGDVTLLNMIKERIGKEPKEYKEALSIFGNDTSLKLFWEKELQNLLRSKIKEKSGGKESQTMQGSDRLTLLSYSIDGCNDGYDNHNEILCDEIYEILKNVRETANLTDFLDFMYETFNGIIEAEEPHIKTIGNNDTNVIFCDEFYQNEENDNQITFFRAITFENPTKLGIKHIRLTIVLSDTAMIELDSSKINDDGILFPIIKIKNPEKVTEEQIKNFLYYLGIPFQLAY